MTSALLGVESMSSCSFQGATPIVDLNTIKKHEEAASCLIPMGITSEMLLKDIVYHEEHKIDLH